MKLNQAKVNEILENHRKWVKTAGLQGEWADLSEVDLRGIDLIGANLVGANLSGVNLSGANLVEANLKGADLREAYLEEANLEKAYLGHANLKGVNLVKVKLSGADLMETNLIDSSLKEAYLLSTFLHNTTKLPFPIYQFYLGKHAAVATPYCLQISCVKEPWDWWLKNWYTAGKSVGYSEWELKKYNTAIDQVYDLIKNEGIQK